MAMAGSARLIKKYPNRRLYDTKTSSYITLVDVKQLVTKNEEFQVIDAKSGEDLTRSILLQIILEEEGGGAPMFSSDVLTQFIRFYGSTMQGMMGSYLERNVGLFNELQQRMQEQSKSILGENPKLNEDWWNQFLSFQGPAMQGLVSTYMDQSRNMFLQMQEKLQSQTRTMFPGFPFPGLVPGAGAEGECQPDAGESPKAASPESEEKG
jgi:polyhydroxyalkanoate synthesis repressor PhaR